MAALDGDLDGIVAAGPGDFILTTEAAGLNAALGDGVLEFGGGVLSRIPVDKNRAEILGVGPHDDLPLHVGGDFDFIGHRALAGSGIAAVDDHIGIHFPFPVLVGEVEEIDAEVETAVASGR